MRVISRFKIKDSTILIDIAFLILFSVVLLRSISPSIFPQYYLFISLGFFVYFIFLQIDFEVLQVFSKHLYVLSIFLLILPLVFGQVTRGAIRWIPLGPLTIQPSEIVRPFLLLFYACYLTKGELNMERLIKAFVLLIIPFFLILIQPSLGVAILFLIGFIGVLLAAQIPKKYLLAALGVFVILIPLFWSLLKPYQRQRVVTFIDPSKDPLGVGYNSIQSMIAVGSGRLFGRGLGEGVQTQLAFLPERHTDFIFAAAAEELGLVGTSLLLIGLFIIFWRILKALDVPQTPTARAYIAAFFLVLFAETVIHVGMNIGLLPITGIPLPLVSAGGSSLLATMIGIAIAVNAKKPARA